jgi:peptidoglycan-associated lipoprotein
MCTDAVTGELKSRLIGMLFLLTPVFFAGCSTTSKSHVETPPETMTTYEEIIIRDEAKSPESETMELIIKEEAKSPESEAMEFSSLEEFRAGEVVGPPASSPLKDVYFDFDTSNLRDDARETLRVNGEWLKANPAAVVLIEGHCDERGSSEYNIALGAQRAQASKDYLVALGISDQRLSTISYGKELPVCQEHNEECWQENRHDRFVIGTAATN